MYSDKNVDVKDFFMLAGDKEVNKSFLNCC